MTFRLAVDLEAGQPYLIDACVDDSCVTGTLTVPENREAGALPVTESGGLGMDVAADTVYLSLPADREWDGTHVTTVSVRTDSGTRVAEHEGSTTFTRVQPNGPGCDPTCWEAEASL